MKDYIQLLLIDPKNLIAIVALISVGILLRALGKKFGDDFNRFESSLAKNESAVADHMSQTRQALASHSSDMGKATKAMAGDMLKIKSDLLDIKNELLQKIDVLRDLARGLEHDFFIFSSKLNGWTDHFDQRIGKVTEIRKELDQAYGRVILLEKDSEDLKKQYAVHNEWMQKAAKALALQKDMLEKLRKHS